MRPTSIHMATSTLSPSCQALPTKAYPGGTSLQGKDPVRLRSSAAHIQLDQAALATRSPGGSPLSPFTPGDAPTPYPEVPRIGVGVHGLEISFYTEFP